MVEMEKSKDERYKFIIIDLPDLGHYEGYALGNINFNYDNKENRHGFLYKCKDKKLVSIDYGAKIPYIKEVWYDIEEYLKRYCKKMGYR